MTRRLSTPVAYLLLILLIGQRAAFSTAETEDITQANFDALDKQFIQLSEKIYMQMPAPEAVRLDRKNPARDSLKQLQDTVKTLQQQGQYFTAIQHIIANLSLINSNINHAALLDITDLLLTHNQWHTFNLIYAEAKKSGEEYYLANINYQLSRYYYARQKWEKSAALLEEFQRNLSAEHYDNALIMKGIILQKSKKHREAMRLYEQVKEQSSHYEYAQLNKVIAEFRQGWWTDARIKINQLLKKFPRTEKADESEGNERVENAEFINRLYLVLGYMLLQNEYYRDSREAFRNIEVDSQYANRALLGIGLTAANQSDYIGALNALTKLKNMSTYDLSVEESHLLLPLVYEKLGQNLTATASYNTAIEYYQQRLKEIAVMIENQNTWLIENLANEKGDSFKLGNTREALETVCSKAFLQNMAEIENFRKNVKAENLKLEIANTEIQYKMALKRMIKTLLEKRAEHLNSYLSQARYGLARLYDSSVIEN